MTKKAVRLFEQFHPENYKLHVALDKKNMKFETTTIIAGRKVGRPSQRLTFHANGIKITAATITRHHKNGDTTIKVDRINRQKRLQEVRLHTKETLFPGSYTVEIEAQGAITKAMQGLYPCYFAHDNQDKFLLATQFESNHAREVFPCIDEPEAKATFDLSITAPNDEVVLSNTEPIKEEAASKKKTVWFEQTPKMSSYLLAFVAGEIHSQEAKTKTGTLVRSWATIDKSTKLLTYSVDEAVKCLEFFEDYFGVPYPLAKCDQVALPDFDAGAMENWGLVTYREILLLADPNNRSISSEQYISMVIAHELSHQWFGNLVTMKWWDDLWLNESFASIMEHMALDAIHPDWHQWEQYVASDVISTSSRDVYSTIQPVAVEVTDPDLIESLFDPGIVYAKGGRLLKMLRDYIGDEAFRKGLQHYFKKFAYQNTSREDLWASLSAASKEDISALMTPWLEKPGMPLVQVSTNADKLTVSQERFLLDTEDNDSQWPVPLLTNHDDAHLLLNKKETTFDITDAKHTLINTKASGHYFVYYNDPEHRQWIAEQIAIQAMLAEARINTLNDIYMLSRGGITSLVDGLNIVKQSTKEPRDNVWALFGRFIGATAQLTDGNIEAEKQIKKLKRELASHWYKKLGWQDKTTDDPNTKQLRHTVLAYMLGGENPQAMKEALSQYQKHMDNLDKIHAEHRGSILVSAVKQNGEMVIDNLLRQYPSASADIQTDITAALASNKDKRLAHYILEKALGPKGFVRPQDVTRWIAYFMRNFHIREVSWQFIKDNWQWIEETLSHSKSFDYVPVYTASVMSTDEWLQEYIDFFSDKKNIKALQRDIEVGIADIKARIDWRKREENKIINWLDQNS